MKILQAFEVGTNSRKFMNSIGMKKADNFKVPENEPRYFSVISKNQFNELVEDIPNQPELIEAVGTRSIRINGVLFFYMENGE